MYVECLETLAEFLSPSYLPLYEKALKRMQRYGYILERFISPEGYFPYIILSVNDLDKYFVKSELTPAIAFDVDTKTVLMLAYMNKESLKKTLETGYTWYWSRSRQEYWNKGATSGHLQKVVSIYADCDNDTLLLNVKQTGAACHTGSYSCFFNEIYNTEEE